MAFSLVGGLIAGGWPPKSICVAEPIAEKRQDLAARFSVRITQDNLEAVAEADVVVLAVKPQLIRLVAEQIGPALESRQTRGSTLLVP